MALKSRPIHLNRRTLYGILALSVAVTLVSVGVFYYLDAYRYPSEETPLVLHSWGISWVRGQADLYQYDLNPPFENMSLCWTEQDGQGFQTSPLNSTFARANMAEFELPENLTTLVETYLPIAHSDNTVNGVRIIGVYGVFVTDENENGLFDYGDAVSLFCGVYENGTLSQQGFPGETEYGIGLGAYSIYSSHIQFNYAIHNGRLYAWTAD